MDGAVVVTAPAVRLTKHEEVAAGTMAFHFEKPEGFRFKAGQAIDLVLGASEGTQGERHAFSLVSAPFEGDLVVATRMRDSGYKRALKDLAIGSTAMVDGPFGSLTLHNDRTRPAVFIAGGIGITPFVSILRQAAEDRLAQRIVLLYSNRRPRDAAFLAELRDLEARNPNFRMVATMTEAGLSAQEWNGETGFINENLLRRVASDIPARPVYYLVGPPAMVEAMRQTLNAVGVDDDDIRSEEFHGY